MDKNNFLSGILFNIRDELEIARSIKDTTGVNLDLRATVALRA